MSQIAQPYGCYRKQDLFLLKSDSKKYKLMKINILSPYYFLLFLFTLLLLFGFTIYLFAAAHLL